MFKNQTVLLSYLNYLIRLNLIIKCLNFLGKPEGGEEVPNSAVDMQAKDKVSFSLSFLRPFLLILSELFSY